MANILWHASPLDLVLRQLNTDPRTGLTLEETRRRLEEHGYNELKKEAKTSPVVLFLNQFKNTLIIILAVATVLSAVIGDLLDAGIILAIIVFCALLGFIQEYRAERALDALRKMLTPTITALRGGREDKIPSKELVPGDIILLEAGDKIPADGRLVEVYSLQCDEAPLTGESFPVEKDLKVLPEEVPVGDRKNMIFTGTAVSYGRGKAVVTNTGADTEFGKIATELATVSQEKTPLEKRTEEIGKWLGIIAVAVCVLVVVTSVIREAVGGRLDLQFTLTMLLFAIALAVAAVPEALAAIVTGALAIGMHEMAKRNALVRKMPAVETLGCATVICSDKTGTLTKGEMTVRRVFGGGEYVDVSGVGYAPEGSLNPVSKNSSLAMLFKGAILCNDSALMQTEGKWSVKGDPTEGALLALGGKAGLQIEETKKQFPRIGEFPFSSDRKRMTTVHKDSGGKRVAFMKGAPEILLGRCSMFFDGDAPKPLSDGERQRILSANEKMASDALRVLGIAYRDLNENDEQSEELVENGLVFLGLIGMMDPPREEAIEAVRVCQQVAIKPVMITGDHKVTAVAVAKELGIYREGDLVFTGEELSKTDDDELGRVVNKITVYARVSPLDKLKIVKAWKERGEVVAMTGDGVNDAPALKHADIGIAMGITGTEVAKEAADIVLSDDNFATIVRAIERGRWIYDNIKKYLTYLLRANITEVVVLGGVVMVMGPQYLPLLPAAILYINLATDGLPALALGVAPADPDIRQRPPRDPRESVFSKDIRMLILLAVIIECPIFLWMFFRSQPDMELARTLVFFMFVFIELIIAINFRSLRYSLIQAPPHKWLLIAIAWELGLIALLIQFPAVRDAFGITIPSIADMGLICAIGIGIVIVIEIAKATFRTTIAQTPMSVRSNSV
jgi:Ca2+-transporting ATPase